MSRHMKRCPRCSRRFGNMFGHMRTKHGVGPDNVSLTYTGPTFLPEGTEYMTHAGRKREALRLHALLLRTGKPVIA